MRTKVWYKSKTIWAAIGLCLIAIGNFARGELDTAAFVQDLLLALGIAGLRLGQYIKLE